MEKTNSILLRWWLLLCAQLSLGIVAYYFDFFHHLYDQDQTRLGFCILGILVATTLWTGKKIYSLKKRKLSKEQSIESFAPVWFVAEACLVLGLIGTVTGFILMLSTAFIGLDVANVKSVQDALIRMSLGMSTALYTTLIGLVSSLAIKIQLVMTERQLEEADVEQN